MLLRNQKGQGLIEYLIIVAIVAVGTLSIVRVLGQNISIQFARITHSLTGSGPNPTFVHAQDKDFQKRDMKNFIEGTTTP